MVANHLSYEVLSRLVEGRASALEEAHAQRHLTRCARCRSEREWLDRIQGRPGGGARNRSEPFDDSSHSIAADWLMDRATTF